MKTNYILLSLILIIGIAFISCNQNKESQNENESKFSKLSGPYLGQKPPGMIPEIFAPGIISTRLNESRITISPDGKEIYFNLIAPMSKHRFQMVTRQNEGHWTEPLEVSSHTPWHKDRYAFISPDGKKMFYNTYRPESTSRVGLWVSDRELENWGNPQRIIFNNDSTIGGGLHPTVATNGNLYFNHGYGNKYNDIYIAKWSDGGYTKPRIVSNKLSAQGHVMHPYIAPDESFLLFDSVKDEDNFGSNDIYVSFRNENGEWTEPQNLGANINTQYGEARSFVSYDGKYLFFTSDRPGTLVMDESAKTLSELQKQYDIPENGLQNFYWVDAKVIEELKPEYLK
ncbi:PD40 domain-containing protein [bacterium]|nr:PD40 domain-containing protein [bacterium]